MHDEPVTIADLLTAWRDATRAAELAERLAVAASEASAHADARALGSAELAELAERAAEAAGRAADRARAVATEAAELARSLRETGIPAAESSVASMRRIEMEAASAFHDAQQHAGPDNG
jgi:hypothetical protein